MPTLAQPHTHAPRPSPAVIARVRPGSQADRAGLRPGDRVVRVEGRAPRDYIDYRFLAAEGSLSLAVETADGRTRRVPIEKTVDEDIGLVFTSDVFDGVKTCGNACVFCFVSQLPRGLRPALYLRDDDYRLSFLHGNFITLTNLTPADRRRIAEYHLSPLYVSVQSTELAVRTRLFGRETPDPMREMRRLSAKGIEFHTQIVICPGLNDGEHLDRSVAGLAALHPGVASIGLVPVGLTSHRGRLPAVPPVTAEMAEELVRRVAAWQRAFRKQLGTRLVYASDELYLRAGRPVPSRVSYEEFPQLGNGIGGVRLFLEDLKKLVPPDLPRGRRVTLVTGEMAAGLVGELAEKLNAGRNLKARVCVVSNRFFGSSVTTAGLLTGQDVAGALHGGPAADLVFVPASAVREGEGFLDGRMVESLAAEIGVPVLAAELPREVGAALERLDQRKA